MKPIAIFVLVAAFSLVTAAASAKTASAPQSDSERVSNTLAGPAPTPNKPVAANTSGQPSHTALKKSKIKAKPPLHDPN